MVRPEIIAELGTGHGGDLGRVRELVAAAAEAGADCAKFQWIIADEIVHPRTGSVHLPGGAVALYEQFRALEQPASFYEECAEACRQHGLAFLCTVFGTESLDRLARLAPRRVKIASPELNHLPLLRAAAERDLHLILSTGVSRLANIERALAEVGAARCELLHCITAYPAPEDEYNLRVIPHLSALFGLPVGVSDHSIDPTLVPACATACGARRIEKHFTLDNSAGGLDDPIALVPDEFREMSALVTALSASATDDLIPILDDRFGAERVRAVLGDGVKRLAASERANYGRSNRSLHARHDLPAGTVITENNTTLLRTEHNLRPGIEPQHLQHALGAELTHDVPAGEGVRWEDLLQSR